jgi:hypothetical protein
MFVLSVELRGLTFRKIIIIQKSWLQLAEFQEESV